MTASSEKVVGALRNALKQVESLREQNRELVAAATEPMAIIGMACRYPGGVRSPEDLWHLVTTGVDAVGPMPTDRGWDLAALDAFGSVEGVPRVPRQGGFLDDVAGFDAGFFRIAPRDALVMDPQQRLLLEVAWEALERAGIVPADLRGGDTGVFVGGGTGDYRVPMHGLEWQTAQSGSLLAGRLAYTLGLQGPTLAVDTGCSSSLVSLHLAAQALRSRECSLALAGGVTVMSTPAGFVEFAVQGALSPDGRCKAFSDTADGTGWSEGAGVLVLERLSDAERNGHRILAVVRGSAVNQDGASNGMTAPNGPAQVRVIRQALANADLPAAGVDVVEAHGTGTRLGDPIEAQALLATYGQDRERPLLLGSIKSNIGHSQAAAGVAGVIKMVQAMRNGILPCTLHVDTASSHVDWTAGAVELLTEPAEWPETGWPRRAGVSAFGASGTNTHVLLERGSGTPAATEPSAVPAGVVPWVLSARTRQALRDQAAALLSHVDSTESVPADIGLSLATSRSGFEHRAVVLAGDTAGAARSLSALAAGTPDAGVVEGTVAAGKTAFVFSGQGSQRLGMGSGLYRRFPVFAEAFDEVAAELAEHLGAPLRDVVWGEDPELLDDTGWTQPALFAVEVALYRLVRSWRLTPDYLIGHSVGEITAAHAAGALALGEACAMVAARARLMRDLPGDRNAGAMVAVEAAEEEVAPLLAGYAERVAIAAVNGPESVVLSGTREAVTELAGVLAERGHRTRNLRVSRAFHSPLMDPMLPGFRAALDGLPSRPPEIPVVSNVTGALVESGELGRPDYWVEHARRAVRFADGVRTLAGLGVTTFLELGPGGSLASMVRQTLDAGEDTGGVAVPLLREDKDEESAAVRALAELHTAGVRVGWPELLAGTGAGIVDLPTYPFQRERFWPATGTRSTDAAGMGLVPAEHPLLGAVAVSAEDGTTLVTGRLSLAAQPWLADHVVGGTVLFPGTGFLELVLAAAERVGCDRVEELTLAIPLVLGERDQVAVQVWIGAAESGRREVRVYSRPGQLIDADWTEHAGGVLSTGAPAAEPCAPWWPPEGARPVDLDGHYDLLAGNGLVYGPSFRGLHAAWRRDGEVLAEVELPEPHGRSPEAGEFGLHPALLDAALQASAFIEANTGRNLMPFCWRGVSLHARGASMLRVRWSGDEGGVTLSAVDAVGAPVITVESLVLRSPSGQESAISQAGGARDSLFTLDWLPVPTGEAPPEQPSYAVLAGDGFGADATAFGNDRVASLAELLDRDTVPEVVLLPVAGRLPAGGPRPVRELTGRVLTLLQEWLATERFAGSRLVIVTSGAAPGTDIEVSDPGASAVWGLVRSAVTEHPGRFGLVDVGCVGDVVVALPVLAEDPQVLVRDGAVHVPRMGKLASTPELIPPPDGPWRVDVTGRGSLDRLTIVACPEAEQPLSGREVRLQVSVAGLNFRDVLNVLGMYPGEAGALGAEAAGVVVEVGPDAADFQVGDRVMGVVPGAMASMVVVPDERLLVRVPEAWSDEEAASVPLVFCTALYAWRDLAGLCSGERVLVHAGAGGVGMAAIQLAHWLGAEVFATASEGKWDVLRGLGVADDHIASSRSLDFEESFRGVLGGGGFDVVLNSLSGEFVDASLRLLAPGGRFLEMGKTDIREARADAENEFFYRAFDLAEAGPARIGELLGELVGLFGGGVLSVLPVRSWGVGCVGEAFRLMGGAGHVGKLVVRMPVPWDRGGVVLVSGGTGGVGGVVARHLVSRGFGRLVLVSRRGLGAPGAVALRDELVGLGAEVWVVGCDVSDRVAVGELVGVWGGELTAVVHAAGVVGDGVVESLDGGGLCEVFGGKVDGGWNLHEATLGCGLAGFVVFSSVAGVLGGGGQGGYAAGNVFVDGLVSFRRGLGLPGVSVAWGPWVSGVGMEVGGRVEGSGVGRIGVVEGVAMFDTATTSHHSLLIAAVTDMGQSVPVGEVPPVLRNLVRTPRRLAAGSGAESDVDLSRRLAATRESERMELLTDLVRAEAAAVLGHASADAVGARQEFRDQGFDSLTAVELRNRVAATSGLRLPATMVFDYPTPATLAAFLLAELTGEGLAAPAPVPVAVAGAEDPIVIVGMSCRYPGEVRSPEALWDLVTGGRDAVSGFPGDRGWELAYGEGDIGTARGGFLYDAAEFDAGFFGISPREAIAMDPQQRLVLEVVWEAFERTGIDPEAVAGTATGVYLGAADADYAGLLVGGPGAEGFVMTGTTSSVISGRVSYTFGLEGPAVTVDTACSSSLVSLHLAAQALRLGECSLALAGGVSVLATPAPFAEFARQGGLAPDGRCKAFSDAADGTGWSEGVGVVVLERLSDAERNGHRVLAVVRGSAVNSDGASNGLTAPNGPSQQRVIRQALASAGLSSSDVDVVEGHGTGTRLGDPIEAQALLATYGQDRETPLLLGSIKSNLGHTQAAAGVAGVIKAVQAMRHGIAPRTLHAEEPTSHVDWSAGAVRLLTEQAEWPETGRPRRTGISSFGVSGTNAHVILEQSPAESESGEPRQADPMSVVPLLLSGRTGAALNTQVGRLTAMLSTDPRPNPVDIGWSLVSGRSVFEHRAVLLVGGGGVAVEVARGVAGVGRTAFVFSGQGSQRLGMGRELYGRFSVFAEAFDEVVAELGVSVREVVWGEDAEVLMGTGCAQPALFAVEVALCRLLGSWGVRPDVVVGHSVGELAAAQVAGVLSLRDACAVVGARARLMQALPADIGAMVAVRAGEREIQPLLESYPGRVSVAAVNAPGSVVLSGEREAVEAIVAVLVGRGYRVRYLSVSHAFHSPLMEPMLAEFARAIDGITVERAGIPVLPTAAEGSGGFGSVEYWVRQVRQPVRFADTVEALGERGVGTVLEVGPDGSLCAAVQETLPEATVVPLLRGDQEDEPDTALRALGRLHVAGTPVDWSTLFHGTGAVTVDLPTYPFQHQHYWPRPSTRAGDAGGLGLTPAEHPFLGAAVNLADDTGTILTGSLSLAGQPWLADHRVGGTVLVPAAALLEVAVRAGDQVGCAAVDELMLLAPLALPDRGGLHLQVRVTAPDSEGRRALTVHARPDSTTDGGWAQYATGTLIPAERGGDAAFAATWPPERSQPVDLTSCYERFAAAGFEYGPVFQGLRAVWQRDDEVFAEIGLPDQATDAGAFGLHPALLDSALHALLATRPPGERQRLPFAWADACLHASGASTLRVRLVDKGADAIAIDAADVRGRPVLSVGSLRDRAVTEVPAEPATAHTRSLFAVEWREVPHETVAPPAPVVLGAGLDGLDAPRVASLDELATVEPAPEVVLVPVTGSPLDAGPGVVRELTGRVLTLLQEWLAGDRFPESRLVLVTSGAVSGIDTEVSDPGASAVWGLVRSAVTEHPGRFGLVDVGCVGDVVVALPVLAEDPQVLVRGGTAHVPRMTPAFPSGTLVPPPDREWRLDCGDRGSIDRLALVPHPEAEQPLSGREVRLQVSVAGLNFRDVLNVLGMYPGEAGALGAEAAGVVVEVGPEASDLEVGDRVMGVVPGAMASMVVVPDERLLVRVPEAWSDEEAASVPLVFCTALYAWRDLAGLCSGERVLVHAGAGGVGMAAVQLAHWLGAEVFATASEGKWDVLRGLGVADDHIASSRSLDFEESFRGVLGGGGFDVVLNSLSGEFVDASLRLLAPGGRFLEMGKTDIRNPDSDRVGLYRAFDLAEAGPARVREMLGELVGLFGGGVLSVLPVRSWGVGCVGEAFRLMGGAGHVGKLVVRMPVPWDRGGVVLVSGGTGGVGGVVARHLVSRGFGRLVLVSRRGLGAPGAVALRDELVGLGAEVWVVGCDVSDRVAVGELVGVWGGELTAVVHAAGVVGDGVVESLDGGGLCEVFGGKVDGGWNLHEATLGCGLAGFVVFSSVAGVLGGGGQGGYAAGNVFVDGLVSFRRGLGLPGVSVAWGPWVSGVGMEVGGRVEGSGVGRIGVVEGVAMFDTATTSHHELLVATAATMGAGTTPPGEVPPMLRELVGTSRRVAADASAASATEMVDRLAGMDTEEQRGFLVDLVRREVAAVLVHPSPETIHLDREFQALGFNSLTAVELRNRLGSATGLRLPATLVFDYATPAALAEHLRAELVGTTGPQVPSVLAELDRLEAAMAESEPDEITRNGVAERLRQLLSRWSTTDSTPESTGVAQRFESASADEILDFIDNELGRSRGR